MFHIGSFDDFAASPPDHARPAPSHAELAAQAAARRKKSAVLLALTGQLLADVRELLAHAAAEVAIEKRRAARRNGEGRPSRLGQKIRRVRKAGRSRR
jgi:hypothetical protein